LKVVKLFIAVGVTEYVEAPIGGTQTLLHVPDANQSRGMGNRVIMVCESKARVRGYAWEEPTERLELLRIHDIRGRYAHDRSKCDVHFVGSTLSASSFQHLIACFYAFIVTG